MYTLITIFYVSLFAIVTMVALKSREVSTGKRTIVSRLGRGTDHVFSAAHSSIKRFISYWNKHTAFALAQWFAFHVLLRVRRVYVEIKYLILQNPHGKRLIDAVRGRGEVRHHGASFYLRRIAEGR